MMNNVNDQLKCPLCGHENECGAKGAKPCWCFSEAIPAGLIQLARQQGGSPSCICAQCVKRFKENPDRFKR